MNCFHSKELINQISSGAFDNRLLDIYVDANRLDYEKERYVKAIKEFENLYGEGDVTIFSAPGRSEIGGNHTDHQHGEVLAASINLDCIAVVRPTDDDIIRFVSEGYDEIIVDITELEKQDEEEGTTRSLVKGVVSCFKNDGRKYGGFCAYLTSDVLIGAGLSSSAAFETILGTILSGVYNDGEVSFIRIAQIGQYAENVYFGKPCGLMDQMACSSGNLVHINFNDPTNPIVEKVDFDLDAKGYSLCITDTKGSHANLTDEYAAIPSEMKAAAAVFGKEVLSDLTMEELLSRASEVREKANDRGFLRALHYVSENQRVKQQVKCLLQDDIDGFLELVKESGNSSYKYLQNVFVSKDMAHQNVSVALGISEMILNQNGNHYGVSRVHGGGFAGTIQAIVKNEFVADYKKMLDSVYGEDACSILKIRKYGGIEVFK